MGGAGRVGGTHGWAGRAAGGAGGLISLFCGGAFEFTKDSEAPLLTPDERFEEVGAAIFRKVLEHLLDC